MGIARILSIGLLLVILAPASCGTNAKGIEDCRSIELARCEASAPCGVITDVDGCQRFYRDHCLHGLAVSPPGSDVINACVDAIRAAGACAASVDGIDCPPPSTPGEACYAVQHPEKLRPCSFLGTTEGEGGSGNGTGGSSSGGDAAAGSPDASGGTAGASSTGGASSGESGGTGANADAG
jgi:hypothetical protein